MDKNRFSIMTFNIRFGLADDYANSWDIRKDCIIDTINKQSPDFLCVQEANDFQLSFLKKNLPDYFYTGIYSYPVSGWQDIPIFYKKNCERLFTDHYFLSDTPDRKSQFKESLWPRQAVTVLFKMHNNFLCITNTHFDFKDNVQQKSADLIRNRLKNFNPEIPQILCGDFNSDPTGVCYHNFTCKNNEKPCFKDPFKNLQSATFHGFSGIPHTGRIDWILYSGDIRPVSKKIIYDSADGVYPSDHFPVLVQFSINQH